MILRIKFIVAAIFFFWVKPFQNETRTVVLIQSGGISVPVVIFVARLDVAGSSVCTGETNAGIDGNFTVLTLVKKKRYTTS